MTDFDYSVTQSARARAWNLAEGFVACDQVGVSTVDVSALLYNPLDLSITINTVVLPLYRVDREFNETSHATRTTEVRVGTPGHLKPSGNWPPRVVLPPHARAVPIHMELGVDHVTQVGARPRPRRLCSCAAVLRALAWPCSTERRRPWS